MNIKTILCTLNHCKTICMYRNNRSSSLVCVLIAFVCHKQCTPPLKTSKNHRLLCLKNGNFSESKTLWKVKIAISATRSSKESYPNLLIIFSWDVVTFTPIQQDSADLSVYTCLDSKVWNTVWIPLLISVLIRGIS